MHSKAGPATKPLTRCSIESQSRIKFMPHDEALSKAWLRRRAHGVKPATDIYLGMSFTTVMPGSGCVGRFSIPPVDSEIGIPASNHEPVDGIGGNEATNFTSEFLQHCHALGSVSKWLETLDRHRRFSQTCCQNRSMTSCSSQPCPPTRPTSQVQALGGAGCRRGDVLAEDDRAPGTRRRKLDHTKVEL
jgi:hypothetical protein